MTLDQFKQLRRKLKVTLLELAATTGLPENYLLQIEEGEIVPLTGDLKRLEKALALIEKDRKEGID